MSMNSNLHLKGSEVDFVIRKLYKDEPDSSITLNIAEKGGNAEITLFIGLSQVQDLNKILSQFIKENSKKEVK